MIPSSWLLLAEGNVRTTIELTGVESPLHWLLVLLAVAVFAAFVVVMYYLDARELNLLWAFLLTGLRLLTIVGLLFIYLYPVLRTEEEKTVNSRVLVLVDTSLSMGLTDSDSGAGTGSRLQQVAAALKQSDFIERLRQTHDVVVAMFDDELHRDRVLSLPKLVPKPQEEPSGGGEQSEARAAENDPPGADPPGPDKPKVQLLEELDWSKLLVLSGQQTRLGQALHQLLNQHAGTPLSGTVLISDGGQNAGIGPEAAIEAARQAKAPIYVVGIGSERLPPNVRIAAFNPPPRAYPGDPYSITGVIQAWRMAGQTLNVQLLQRDAASAVGSTDRGTGDLIDSAEVTLGADGEEVPVKFEVTPKEVGRRTLCLKVMAPENDRDRGDNLLEADIEIVDRKNRVLLFAGGPAREYQFLRNQLYRDKTVISDVLLQTAKQGISQEANEILDEFPDTREALYKYDCIVAFDADWQELTAEQINLLEGWVAEQGGGLIVVAGPVYTAAPLRGWVQDPAMAKIRGLYPVEFPRRLTAGEEKMHTAEEPWPPDFTREGLEAEFLALTDLPVSSRQAWAAFPGVFSCFPVRGPKPGATVLARFSDPRAASGGEQPVYLAWQFYGSGRVAYLGSGEMWRLRGVDPPDGDTYFERFYTKLIRHISKGRLLRGSTRGMLLVGQERYWLGNTVAVQAFRLTNAQLEPLEVPNVTLQVVQPNQGVQTVTLRPDAGRPGTYLGQFTVLQEGDYRLELPLPDSPDERLTQRIRVEMPNLEREHPQRNDALLGEIATKTDGKYFVGFGPLLSDPDSLVGLLRDRTKIVILSGSPSRWWEEAWLRAVMYALFGLLCLEWLIRRLLKLA